MTDILRSLLSEDGIRTFSQQALWAAGQSQQPTAIPALVTVAALSLLVVVLWIWAVAVVWRRIDAHR